MSSSKTALTTPQAPASAPVRVVGRALATLLALLTVFGPISMDLYVPALPALTLELDAATSLAQLIVTAWLIGLALGQLVAGLLSDRFGRRIPLLVGRYTFRCRVRAAPGRVQYRKQVVSRHSAGI